MNPQMTQQTNWLPGLVVLGLVFVAAVYLLPRGFAGTRLSRRGSGPRRTAAP